MPWTSTASDYPAVREALHEALRSMAVGRLVELDPGMEIWIGHLLWLKSGLAAGVVEAKALLADEAEGLRILDEVARKVGEKLRKCPQCGAFTESYLGCASCGKSFVARASRP